MGKPLLPLQVSHLIEAWQPWWHSQECAGLRLTRHETLAVQMAHAPSDDSNHEAEQRHTSLPAPPAAPLVPLSELTAAVPSPLLRWQLLELLYAYCLVMRLYNGEPAVDLHDAAAALLEAAPFLRQAMQQPSLPSGFSQDAKILPFLLL